MDPQTKQFFNSLTSQEANKTCIDCGAAHPQWASISYGTYFCLQCSGVHRSLGVHISFVRSITMDTWNEKQKKMMQLGGNGAFRDFAKAQGIDRMQIREKYHTKAAEYYRDALKAKHDGTAPPPMPAPGTGATGTSGMPASSNTTTTNRSTTATATGGFGNPAFNYTPPGNNNTSNYSAGSYQTGGGNDFFADLTTSATSLFASAKQTATVLASEAGSKISEVKNKAEDDGWFDFDKITAKAKDLTAQVQNSIPQTVGLSRTVDPGHVYHQPQEPAQQQQFDFQQQNPSAPAMNHHFGSGSSLPYNSNTSTSQFTSAESGSRASSQPPTTSSKPLQFTHTTTAAQKQPAGAGAVKQNLSSMPISLSPPDMTKKAEKKPAVPDVWDSEKWFDEM